MHIKKRFHVGKGVENMKNELKAEKLENDFLDASRERES